MIHSAVQDVKPLVWQSPGTKIDAITLLKEQSFATIVGTLPLILRKLAELRSLTDFTKSLALHDERSTMSLWLETVRIGIANAEWQRFAAGVLLQMIEAGRLPLVRSLIGCPDCRKFFFPLSRALDYVETKDERLLLNLTPEVKVVVEDISRLLEQIGGTHVNGGG